MAEIIDGATPAPEAPATRADMLREQFDALEQEQAQEPAAPAAKPAAEEPAPAAETAEQKAGRTAGRPRDAQGRLLPGKPEKQDSATVAAKPPTTPLSPGAVAAPAVAEPSALAAPAAPTITRPSTWKKDHWDGFDKLAREQPALAQYINQRETEFARGVSTYKNMWDTAKPLIDAVAPFQQAMQQQGVAPAQAIQSLFTAHHRLQSGNDDQKLEMLATIIRDYKLPVANMFQRGEDGQIYYSAKFNAALQQQAPQPQQRQPQADPRTIYREIIAEERALSAVEQMAQNTEQYPHYEVLAETMTGLLQAGVAKDLPDAYERALRQPEHDHLREAQQQQQRQAEEQSRRAELAATAQRARKNAFSPASATPTASAASGATGKSRREILAESFDAISSGRV